MLSQLLSLTAPRKQPLIAQPLLALVLPISTCSYLMAACNASTRVASSGLSATFWHALSAGSYKPAGAGAVGFRT